MAEARCIRRVPTRRGADASCRTCENVENTVTDVSQHSTRHSRLTVARVTATRMLCRSRLTLRSFDSPHHAMPPISPTSPQDPIAPSADDAWPSLAVLKRVARAHRRAVRRGGQVSSSVWQLGSAPLEFPVAYPAATLPSALLPSRRTTRSLRPVVHPAWLHFLWDPVASVVFEFTVTPFADDVVTAAHLIAGTLDVATPEVPSPPHVSTIRAANPHLTPSAPLIIELPWSSARLDANLCADVQAAGVQFGPLTGRASLVIERLVDQLNWSVLSSDAMFASVAALPGLAKGATRDSSGPRTLNDAFETIATVFDW